MSRSPRQDFFLFLIGGALFAAGVFLFTNQVMVGSGFRGFGMWGRGYGGGMGSGFGGLFSFGVGQGFGLLMIPFGIGVALLLADAYRKVAWFFVWASSAALGVGVLQSLLFSFRTTSLFNLLAIIVMVAAGGGLMFKSLRDYQDGEVDKCVGSDESVQELRRIKEELDELKSRMNKG